MNDVSRYPSRARIDDLACRLGLWADLQHERGARGLPAILKRVERVLSDAVDTVQTLPPAPRRPRHEPDDLAGIRRLRPSGPRRLRTAFEPAVFGDRLAGALLGRMAGCTLGAPIESSPIALMESLARHSGEPFPPRDYLLAVPHPYDLRYGRDLCRNYTRPYLKGVPVDDDIVYTILGLLTVERYGADFTTADVGAMWLEKLPMACTAEKVALDNLRRGIPAERAAERDNPYVEWIGADIRADPWGYIAAGWPERAAAMAYRDARLSHRGQGVYGAMYFAAAIAAAFAVDDPVPALRIGLTEIPARCALARHLRWALDLAPCPRTYREARAAVDARFPGMHPVHTVNNACLTVFGIRIGGLDITRVLGETVAMGLDNDCTAATAGSLVGAVIGKRRIPKHWYRPFGNQVRTYLRGHPRMALDGLIRRFQRQAKRLRHQADPASG